LVVVCRLGRPCRHGLGDRIRCSAIDSTSEPLTRYQPDLIVPSLAELSHAEVQARLFEVSCCET
jgi:hypothetical protein